MAGSRLHSLPFCLEWQFQRLLSESSSPFYFHHLDPRDPISKASFLLLHDYRLLLQVPGNKELSVPLFLELLQKSTKPTVLFLCFLQSREGNEAEMNESHGEVWLHSASLSNEAPF